MATRTRIDDVSGRPTKIVIEHDDYHAEFVGRTSDGLQFFMTTPFKPATNGEKGCEYLALYLFDLNGNLSDARIESFGPRKDELIEAKRKMRDQWLSELSNVQFCRIEVKPFEIRRFSTLFGLVVRVPEDEDEVWAVNLLPGDYMAFFEPWDSGIYDT